MAIQIPEGGAWLLSDFIRLERDKIDSLIHAIKTTPPSLSIRSFAAQVASQTKIAPDLTKNLVLLFAGLYLTCARAGVSYDDVASELQTTLLPEVASKTKVEDWHRFHQDVNAIVSCEQTLGVTAKANNVMVDHEHVFHECRIISDLRPIFTSDTSKPPAAGVIVHMLSIVYRMNGEIKRTSYALDRNDLNSLKGAISRAESKEHSIERAIINSNFHILK